MRKSSKIIVAVAFAGLAAAGSAAFTGSGLSSSAGATQFIGGTVNQGVSGATLTDVEYSFTDATKTATNQVLLTFATDADGKTVAISLSGSGATAFTCTDVEILNHTSTCSPDGAPATGVTGANITVS